MMKKISLLIFSSLIFNYCNAQQTFYFGATEAYLELEEMTIPSFPMFHSAAVGSYDGKWFIMGGRTNGLHGFYPPFAFPSNGIQRQIYVVDYAAGSVWSSNLDSLPQPLKEQLSSSNLQQCVIGNKMYISGGYGYSASQDEFITFPYLTEVDLPSLSQAVIAGTSPASSFKYTVDSNMAVTGGRMLHHGERLYLIFGHKFTGRYSITPGDLFEQEYTHQIRMFDVGESNDSIHIINYAAVTDSVNFRRRDLNVTPYVKINGSTDTVGFMAWSGVFKKFADRPHTDQIFIRTDGSYSVINHLQKYNQYHCAAIPMRYLNQQMQVAFIGGMAEGVAGSTDLDTLVPFVKNVSVMYDYWQNYSELLGSNSLLSFWGTNSEFIATEDYLEESTGVIDVDFPFCEEKKLIGHIIGGIESTGPHISDLNDPSLSFASSKIYKVFAAASCWSVNEYNISSIQVYPNPSQDKIQVKTDEIITEWQVLDISGKTVITKKSGGINSLDVSGLESGTYFVKVLTEQHAYRSSFIKL